MGQVIFSAIVDFIGRLSRVSSWWESRSSGQGFCIGFLKGKVAWISLVRCSAVILSVLLLIPFGRGESTWAGDDWQYWSSYRIGISLDRNLSFEASPECRFNDNFANHYETRADIVLRWTSEDWLVSGVGYLYANVETDGNWQAEHRPHFDAEFKWWLSALCFTDRSRFEYRIRKDKRTLRYRNKLMVKLPKLTRCEIQPFAAEEPFYSFDGNGLNKNRVYTGIGFRTVGNLRASIYYISESRRKQELWMRVGILGTKLELSL